jgi:hypothetical protein
MLTDAGYPATSVENLKNNTFRDGLFHGTTYIFVVMGLIVLWRASRGRHIRWSTKLLAGTLLLGFGLFNLGEGIVDHHGLGRRRAGVLGVLGHGWAALARDGRGEGTPPGRTVPASRAGSRLATDAALLRQGRLTD